MNASVDGLGNEASSLSQAWPGLARLDLARLTWPCLTSLGQAWPSLAKLGEARLGRAWKKEPFAQGI